jgi:hypothetical protein
MPTSPPGLISLPQVSSAVGRLFRRELDTKRENWSSDRVLSDLPGVPASG